MLRQKTMAEEVLEKCSLLCFLQQIVQLLVCQVFSKRKEKNRSVAAACFLQQLFIFLSSLFSKTKKNPKETYLAAACFLKQLFIFLSGLFAERERKLMHVPSAFENTEIPLHCHEVKIPHERCVQLLHACFRKYKQCFDISVTAHLAYAIADISIEGQNRLVFACWVLGTKAL
jgi:hypothetical protein